MIGGYSCVRCVTTWGAILNVLSIGKVLVSVSDPDAVDAGQYIGVDDIQTIWKISMYKDFSHPQFSNKDWARFHQYF